ncbi:divalent metal cation transporter, partial [Staphylococcus hominis]|uniref:divalent metal cation transporter n=1 Tax=Staphylococcus hominis TaxID=1290 RepID=UPI0016437D9E
ILLFIILLSTLSAILFQTMTLTLPIPTHIHLPQITPYYLNPPLPIIFCIIPQLPIISTHIAQVSASPIPLHLLFNMPLIIR